MAQENRKKVPDLRPAFVDLLRQVHGTETVVIPNGLGQDTTGTPETETGDIFLTDRARVGLMDRARPIARRSCSL